MSTTEQKPKKDGLNYKVEFTAAPAKKDGQKGPYVEAKAKTTIKGKEKEITLRAFGNMKDGKVTEKSQKAMDDLAAKKVGDKSNLFGKVVSWTDKSDEKKKGIYFQVLAVDAKPPVKKKEAPAQEMA